LIAAKKPALFFAITFLFATIKSDIKGALMGASDRKSTVLIVEDNEQNLELLKIYMEDVPEAHVITANNGIEALEQIEANDPDLVLLDIMMPRMSGFEVCKRIKSDPRRAISL